nr:PD-(D/E)XK nuclease family protein [uncultured Flavobacterium sp.]
MENNHSFLQKLANELFEKFNSNISDITIVLPNKRAKVFLIEALKNKAEKTIFAPNIISIEDFVQDVAQIQTIDNVELLFEFYKIYTDLTKTSNIQSFEIFANWGKILLQDFNEIDRYLLEPKRVFSYLTDVEVLKRWNLEPEERTKMIDSTIDFWNKLPVYYQNLQTHLLSKSIGYQGLIYKQAVKNMESYADKLEEDSIVFAGFNALNQAEERIFQYFLQNKKALVYWDIDRVFLNDNFHDAGLFVRKFKNKWPFYKDNNFEWIVNSFSESKNIEVIGTPKTVGQAKIAAKIVENILDQQNNLNKVAVILGDENLLMPVLYALPNQVPALNITMGYSNKNNPVQILIQKIFKLHINALNRESDQYLFYYKDLIDILAHPLVEKILNTSQVIQTIKKNNITFISSTKLNSLFTEKSDFFAFLFSKWDQNIDDILNRLLAILTHIKNALHNDVHEDLITKTFVLSVFKGINKLKNYYLEYRLINSVDMLFTIYKQTIDLEDVSFEGEPLSGLQVMGVLESRVLDFDTVIITSMNEGVFPAGKGANSFIPSDIKVELGLPTFKEKDAIYSYHFYHALLRAKNIYLLYNSDPADGLDKGEISRFITQLEIEKQPNHLLSKKIYNAYLPEKAKQEMEISKSDKLLIRLQDIAQNKGFSPSSLTTYLRNPIDFYKKRVLGIGDLEDVEENVAVNTLGTIIHGALEDLYEPVLGKFLSESDLLLMMKNYPEVLLKRFKDEYKDGEISRGKNLIAFEVAKRNILNFLDLELKAVKAGDAIKVLHLEHNLSVEIVSALLPYPVKISGNVDRIELRNGKYRIIDYKTGKVEAGDVKITKWEDLLSIKKDKVIQLLCYALMFKNTFTAAEFELEVGIISFKNLKAGFMPFVDNSTKESVISDSVLANFETEIIALIHEILDAEHTFVTKNT